MRTRRGRVEPEVYFRILHAAQIGHNGAPLATYREQAVEIAVESKGVFKNDPVANVTRRMPVERSRSRPRSQNRRGLPNF